MPCAAMTSIIPVRTTIFSALVFSGYANSLADFARVGSLLASQHIVHDVQVCVGMRGWCVVSSSDLQWSNLRRGIAKKGVFAAVTYCMGEP